MSVGTLSINVFLYLSRLVTCVGELDISNPEISPLSTPLHTPSPSHSTLPQVLSQSPYLLLDVREKEDYDKCHIITGMYT